MCSVKNLYLVFLVNIALKANGMLFAEELTFAGSLPYSEVQVGRAMCGIVALVDRRTRSLAVFQQHLLKLRHRLRCDGYH
jgi:hypothetical protein